MAAALGLLLAYFLAAGFARAVDSSGFDFRLHPVYDLIGRSLEGAFGGVVVQKLFAEGPFQLVLYVAFLPVLLFLAASSVYRFGLERKVGAVELLAYGPADGTSYFLAFLVKDLLATLLYLAALTGFLAVGRGAAQPGAGPHLLPLPRCCCPSCPWRCTPGGSSPPPSPTTPPRRWPCSWR